MCNENFNSKKESEDMVNHPSHYTWLKEKCGVEVIDITRHMNFDLGNAVKYILRAGKKCLKRNERQAKIEDLQKAIWYINDEISRFTKNQPDLKVDNNTCNCEGECSCNEAEESPVENDKIDFYIGKTGKAFGLSYALENKVKIFESTNYPGKTVEGAKNLMKVSLNLVTYKERAEDSRVPYYSRNIKTCYEITVSGSRELDGFCPVNMARVYVTYHTNIEDLINLVNRMSFVLMESYDIIEVDSFFKSNVNVVDYKEPDHSDVKFKRGTWYDKNNEAKFPGYSVNTVFGVDNVTDVLFRTSDFINIGINRVDFKSINTTPRFYPSIIEVRIVDKETEEDAVYSTNSTDINSIVDFIYKLPSWDCLSWKDKFEKYFAVYE